MMAKVGVYLFCNFYKIDLKLIFHRYLSIQRLNINTNFIMHGRQKNRSSILIRTNILTFLKVYTYLKHNSVKNQ